MSKIALTPNSLGSGTFTIASPNSNTDRTLTLPDEAGTVLTSASDIDGRLLKYHKQAWNTQYTATGNADWADTVSVTYTPVSSSSYLEIEAYTRGGFHNLDASDARAFVHTRLDIDGVTQTDEEAVWFRLDGTNRKEVPLILRNFEIYQNTSTSNKVIKVQWKVSGHSSAKLAINQNGNATKESYVIIKEYSGSITVVEAS